MNAAQGENCPPVFPTTLVFSAIHPDFAGGGELLIICFNGEGDFAWFIAASDYCERSAPEGGKSAGGVVFVGHRIGGAEALKPAVS